MQKTLSRAVRRYAISDTSTVKPPVAKFGTSPTAAFAAGVDITLSICALLVK